MARGCTKCSGQCQDHTVCWSAVRISERLDRGRSNACQSDLSHQQFCFRSGRNLRYRQVFDLGCAGSGSLRLANKQRLACACWLRSRPTMTTPTLRRICRLETSSFAKTTLRAKSAVIDVFASASLAFPFVVGSKVSSKARSVRVTLDKSGLPRKAKVMLKLTGNNAAFPQVDFDRILDTRGDRNDSIVVQDRAKVMTRIGCCDVRMTLERNSKLEFVCAHQSELTVRSVKGGRIIVADGEQLVQVDDNRATIDFDSRRRRDLRSRCSNPVSWRYQAI